MNAARTQAFAAALAAVDAALDWEALAALYCHDDGAGFFRREQREAIQDTGLHFAADLGGFYEFRYSVLSGPSLVDPASARRACRAAATGFLANHSIISCLIGTGHGAAACTTIRRLETS